MSKKSFDVLKPYSRAYPDWESQRAETLFKEFMEGNLPYEEISHHPDCLFHASAELLTILLPKLIDEMLRRKDIENFLVYPMTLAVDPEYAEMVKREDKKSQFFPKGSESDWKNYEIAITMAKERTDKLITLADTEFIEKICHFLSTLKSDPPVSEKELDRLLKFWQDKNRSKN